MAKWGEGDPRWIVEERPDATNVNNWHWTEKNADAWSKKKLESLLVNCIIEDPKVGNVVLEEIEKCEGEARANNRKAKLIFFYEWELTLKWKGHVNGKENEIEGKVEIPNLSEEHEDMNDVDVDIQVIKCVSKSKSKATMYWMEFDINSGNFKVLIDFCHPFADNQRKGQS